LDRIFYFGGEWFIIDGDMIRNGSANESVIYRESANGTWISLVDYRTKNERQESEPKLLEDESEIKISDTILKVFFILNFSNIFVYFKFEYPKKSHKISKKELQEKE